MSCNGNDDDGGDGAVMAMLVWPLVLSRASAVHGQNRDRRSPQCRGRRSVVPFYVAVWALMLAMRGGGCVMARVMVGKGVRVRRGKSAPCWQPVVDGDGVGPDHDILSTKALTRRTAEAVRWLWLFRMPPCMMCRWCGSGRNMELACERRAWSQARKPTACRKPQAATASAQHNNTL